VCISGTGLRSGIADQKSKFTILVSDTIGVFNLLVEIRGPNHEYCGERIVSLHQYRTLLDKPVEGDNLEIEGTKFLEDCAGTELSIFYWCRRSYRLRVFFRYTISIVCMLRI